MLIYAVLKWHFNFIDFDKEVKPLFALDVCI